MKTIPFNRPTVSEAAFAYLREAVSTGHLSGDGIFTKRCHALLQEILGSPKVLLTTSCTHALEMCALLLDIKPGDEVLLPSFTFVSTVNAFVLRGAKPVFVDIRPDTLNLDESLLARHIGPATRVIVPVHYAGVGCEMEPIRAQAERHTLAVVEDNAHGLMGAYKGKALGTFGSLATLSFHETKNFSCGEGGALVINDPRFAERAEVLREKGTNRNRFYRGQVDKYTWVDIGSSYLPADALAALLLAQLENRHAIQQRRQQLWLRYAHDLRQWADEQAIRLPFVPAHCQQAFHLFYLLMPSLEDRHDLILHLKKCEIHAVFHYLPLHLSEMGRSFGGVPGACPVTEDISDRLVRLPFFFDLADEAQARVIQTLLTFKTGKHRAVTFTPLRKAG